MPFPVIARYTALYSLQDHVRNSQFGAPFLIPIPPLACTLHYAAGPFSQSVSQRLDERAYSIVRAHMAVTCCS